MCKPGSGRCGHRPLRSVYRQDFVGGDAHIAPRPLQGARKNGRGRTPPLRKGCKRCGEVKNPPVTASPCQPPLGKGPRGRGMRIATASLRTGLAMTWFLQEVRWAGRCGHRPLRSVYRQDFVGGDAHIAPRPLQGARKNGRGRTPPLRKGCKRCGEVKNPPVTASPCQPPLGKGPRGRGMRIATASLRTGLAMTWFLQGAGARPAGGQGRSPLRDHFGFIYIGKFIFPRQKRKIHEYIV